GACCADRAAVTTNATAAITAGRFQIPECMNPRRPTIYSRGLEPCAAKAVNRTREPMNLEPLESEPHRKRRRSHRPYREDLTEGRRVDGRVDRRVVDRVEQVRRIHLQRDRTVAAHPNVAGEL